jgi:hypothetical protein
MMIESSDIYFRDFEAKIETLDEQDQILAKHILKFMKADYYNQDRHIRRFTKTLNDQAETDPDKLNRLVDLTQKMLGDYNAAIMEYIINHASEYPYSTGYERRPFRTKNISAHLSRIVEKCASLHDFAKHRVTIMDILTNQHLDPK